MTQAGTAQGHGQVDQQPALDAKPDAHAAATGLGQLHEGLRCVSQGTGLHQPGRLVVGSGQGMLNTGTPFYRGRAALPRGRG